MRNTIHQVKPTNDGCMLVHSWDTRFCDHITKAPLTRALERINGKITKIELAWEAFKQAPATLTIAKTLI